MANPTMPQGVNIFREIGAAPEGQSSSVAPSAENPQLKNIFQLLQSGETAKMIQAKKMLDDMVSVKVNAGKQAVTGNVPPAPELPPKQQAPASATLPAAQPVSAPTPAPAPAQPQTAPGAAGQQGAPAPAQPQQTPAPAPTAQANAPQAQPGPGPATQQSSNVLLDLVKVIQAAGKVSLPNTGAALQPANMNSNPLLGAQPTTGRPTM